MSEELRYAWGRICQRQESKEPNPEFGIKTGSDSTSEGTVTGKLQALSAM